MAKTLDEIIQDQLGALLMANARLAAENEALRAEVAGLKAAAEKAKSPA